MESSKLPLSLRDDPFLFDPGFPVKPVNPFFVVWVLGWAKKRADGYLLLLLRSATQGKQAASVVSCANT